MAYTHAWDETAPADTSLANLLGQVVRNLKTDIHERLLLSGLAAQRPTPESVFVGMIFLATDTHKFYRWNGSSWDDVTTNFTGAQVFKAGAVSQSSSGALSSVTIPGGTLASGSVLKIKSLLQQSSGGSGTFRLEIGALAGSNITVTVNQTAWLDAYVFFDTSTSCIFNGVAIDLAPNTRSFGNAGTPPFNLANPLVVRGFLVSTTGGTTIQKGMVVEVVA